MSNKDESIVVASLSAGYAMLRTLDLLMTAQSRVSVGQLYEVVIGLESVPDDYLSGWTGVLFPATIVHEPGPDGTYVYQLRIREPARAFSFYDKPPTVETFEHELEGCSDEPAVSDRILAHFKKRKTLYISIGCVAIGIGIAVLTGHIMKNFNSRGIPVTTSRGIPVTGEGSEFFANHQGGLFTKNVTNFTQTVNAYRQGPPSWVIRCLETGESFMSQNKAATAMGLSPAEISRHLNGALDDVRGYHFERICMAA